MIAAAQIQNKKQQNKQKKTKQKKGIKISIRLIFADCNVKEKRLNIKW